MRSLIAIFFFLPAAFLSAANEKVAGIDPLEAVKQEFEAGRIEAALTALDAANKETVPAAQVLDLRGCIFLEQQKFDEALKEFRAAHEADATLYTPPLHVADTLLRQKKWEEARAFYETTNKGTNVLIFSERLRYGILIACLGAKDDAAAQTAFDRIVFPTETAAFYYAQAAWAFAHGNTKAGTKWMRTADGIFDAKKMAWFARPLYELGWIKNKPTLVLD